MYRYSNNTLTKAPRKMILTPLRDSPVESILRLRLTANFRKKSSHFFLRDFLSAKIQFLKILSEDIILLSL
jgi:hypothetical protein